MDPGDNVAGAAGRGYADVTGPPPEETSTRYFPSQYEFHQSEQQSQQQYNADSSLTKSHNPNFPIPILTQIFEEEDEPIFDGILISRPIFLQFFVFVVERGRGGARGSGGPMTRRTDAGGRGVTAATRRATSAYHSPENVHGLKRTQRIMEQAQANECLGFELIFLLLFSGIPPGDYLDRVSNQGAMRPSLLFFFLSIILQDSHHFRH